jgi:hypothetical protein
VTSLMKKQCVFYYRFGTEIGSKIVVYLTSSCVNWAFFWHEWARFKGPRVPRKLNLHKNELNTTFICSTSPKGFKLLKIFKISVSFWKVVTFIKIHSHRRKFSNSDSVEQKKKLCTPWSRNSLKSSRLSA